MKLKICLYLLTVLVFISSAVSAQSEINPDDVFNLFAYMDKENLYKENLSVSSGEEQPLPFGIKKTVAQVPIKLIVSHINFEAAYTEATIFVKIELPQSKPLIFGAKNVKLSYDGDIVGDTELGLLQDIPIPMGNMGKIIIRGALDEKTGAGGRNTHIVIGCNGDFKYLSLDADVELNPNIFIPAKQNSTNKNDTVTGRFVTKIEDLNNWLVNVSFPAFEIKGLKDFVFEISNATLDMSDKENPVNMYTPGEYFRKYFSLPDIKLWQGIYVEKFSVTLPPQFSKKDSSAPIKISAEHLMIDENGITASIFGENILPLSEGNANGWPFSVNKLSLSLIANNISQFGFEGQIQLPTSKDQKPSNYTAAINLDGEYFFNVSLGDSLKIDLVGGAVKAVLKETSCVEVTVSNNVFKPALILDGYMTVGGNYLNLDKISFRRLRFHTDAPYLNAEYFGYEGTVSLKGIPVTINDIGLVAKDQEAGIAFNMKLNLMEEKISASSRAYITSEYKNGHWQFKRFAMDEIALDNVNLGGFSLSGKIFMKEDDPVYGNCFGGKITALFSSLSDGLVVGVDAIFGRKDDFRYWSVDGAAKFPGMGVPVGFVSLNGFTGGASYHMKASPRGYIPDKTNGLGVRAGVAFCIMKESVISGDAMFEMNFLSSGGIAKMAFYAQAVIMSQASASGDLNKLQQASNEKNGDMGKSLAADLPKGQSGSEVAKNVYPLPVQDAPIQALLTMEYDFLTKTFDANFQVKISVAGGLIKGTNPENVAGWANLHISPQTWYIHAGTPSQPMGVQFGLGSLSLKTTSYLMIGDHIPPAPAPPKEVTEILGITQEDADYMKNLNVIGDGKGFAFGSNLSFSTGDLTFLILYANFKAGFGFDVMLKDYSGYHCAGHNGDIGINGWYANGQCYAYLQGELGVKINLFLVKKKIPVIKGGTAALLQAKLPNPSWMGGYMGINLNVLGGLVKANMRMKFSFGDDCKLVSNDEEASPIDMPVISDLSPGNNSSDVDIFTSPQATFNMSVGNVFEMDDENGTKSYRIRFDEFYVQDSKGNKIQGDINWNSQRDAADFIPKEVMPPYSDMTAFVSVKFEEWTNNSWKTVMINGKEAKETKKVQFKTGDAPDYIPLKNVKYAYPVINQKNYYSGETSKGYIQLKQGQSYLFPNNFKYEAVLASNESRQSAAFNYNAGNALITFDLPNLEKSRQYHISLDASSLDKNNTTQANEPTYRSSTVKDDDGGENTISYKSSAAKSGVTDGSLCLLEYDFGSSRYGTLSEKLSDIKFTTGSKYVTMNIRSLLLGTESAHELFDEAELTGTAYTDNKPLIQREAILTDDYYTKDIAPLIYNWYGAGGTDGIKLQDRDVNIWGLPPVFAFQFVDGYLQSVTSGTYNAAIQKAFPFVYDLTRAYYIDYYDLRNQVVNKFMGTGLSKWDFLVNSPFPRLRKDKYKTKFQYVMPGDKKGTAKEMEYECDIN